MQRLYALLVCTTEIFHQVKNKCYAGVIKLNTFDERFEYLQLHGLVGEETFGYSRYLNQILYRSPEWKALRQQVILRDRGCDLAMDGYEICGKILIHHIRPISLQDIEERDPKVFDMNNLITVSFMTHQAIHYGSKELLLSDPVERRPNDQAPWR